MQWASTKYFNQVDFLGRSVTTRTGKGKTRDPETSWGASVLVPIRLTEGLEQRECQCEGEADVLEMVRTEE